LPKVEDQETGHLPSPLSRFFEVLPPSTRPSGGPRCIRRFSFSDEYIYVAGVLEVCVGFKKLSGLAALSPTMSVLYGVVELSPDFLVGSTPRRHNCDYRPREGLTLLFLAPFFYLWHLSEPHRWSL